MESRHPKNIHLQSVSEIGDFIQYLSQPTTEKVTLSLDWKEIDDNGISILQNILNFYDIEMQLDPDYEGTDRYGWLLSKKKIAQSSRLPY